MKMVWLTLLVACSSAPAAIREQGSIATTNETPPGGGEAVTPAARDGSSVPAPMRALLESHNRRRAEHCAPPLAWSAELAGSAQGWADSLAARGCAFEHSQSDYGENLAGGTSPMDGEAVTELWYRESAAFNFRRGGFSMDTGHFTQLVWIGTQRVGCGVAQCNGLDVWVCNYDPAGNIQGQYRENVRPTSCR